MRNVILVLGDKISGLLISFFIGVNGFHGKTDNSFNNKIRFSISKE